MDRGTIPRGIRKKLFIGGNAMVKIRVEDTYTNKVFETECDGALISMHQRKGNNRVAHSIVIGRFNIKLLKLIRKDIKEISKKAIKGEGIVE